MSGRKPGQRPGASIDFFPDDFLLFIDESHVTIPQVGGMYNGDYSRKKRLVDYGFGSFGPRQPTLKPDEFEEVTKQTVYAATPAMNWKIDRRNN